MNSTLGLRRTGIFTKVPEPGYVKTRLSPPLTPETAAGLAEAMLSDTVARFQASRDFKTSVVFAPRAAESWFQERFPGLDLVPQTGAGLAVRLARYFEDVLAGAKVGSLVVVGSDQPLVPVERVVLAHDALQAGADLVLGPDLGGGYYLVGLRQPRPELFLEVPMSTAGMFERTLNLAGELNLSVELLEPSVDIDEEKDLLFLREELRGRLLRGLDTQPDFPHATCAFLDRLEPLR